MSETAAADDTGPLSCAKCGCSSTLRSHFVRGKDGTVPRIWCPTCAVRRHERMVRFSVVASMLALPLAWFLSTRLPGDFLLTLIVGVYVFLNTSFLMVIPHELGHALLARLVGFPPVAIAVGSGTKLIDRYVFGVRLQFGITPAGGATTLELRQVEGFKWRMIAVLAAGPAVNLIAGIVALAWMPGGAESPQAHAARVGFGTANLVKAFANLWPKAVRTPYGRVASDGAQILARMADKAVDLRAHAAAVQFRRASFAYADRDYAATLRALAQAESLSDEVNFLALVAVLRAEALSESGDARAGLESLVLMRSRADLSEQARLALDGAYAWAAFMCDEPLLARDGLQYAQSCASLMPWEPVLRIKHICLLSAFPADATAVNEARRLADSLRDMRLEGESRAYGALARGMVAAAEGNRDLASAELAMARRLRASPAALALLERRLS